MERKKEKEPFFIRMPAFKRMKILQNQKSAHYKIIFKKEKVIEKINQKIIAHFPEMCKELTDEILSKDLTLSAEELAFLTIPIWSGKGKPKIRLLQELIRRQLNSGYFTYIDPHVSVSLLQIHKAIGEETNRKTFITNLNKKFKNIIKFKIQLFTADKKDYRRAITGQLITN